ncbi:unnamed protein product [Cuscuta campestris]|uniref:CCHC-type domain-containing protein n=1 Tax=Cuscuta campestris TaxID=132261 RepID=A0A484K5Z9_9ASTE|nr:unnamed protein product [Cuscuta campestris]
MMAHYMQHMAQFMPMFQPPPPPQPQPRIVTFKMLKDNGAEVFRGENMGEPQIALDWLEQMDRVLKNLRVPDADRSELASQMFRKGAYDWWKRIDQDPHTPKPWTWDRFDRAFTKEYIPTRYREERRDEFVALKQEGMSLPELRQRFDYLSQYATSLVSTPEDRLNEFVKKLRPDLRPYAALITTTDFNAAYDLIVKTEKSLDDLQATKKEDRATKDPRPAASTGPSGKSFGFGGKRYEKGSSSAPPPKRSKSRPSPSAAASNSNRTRSHPQCVHCGRHHPGECWLAHGLCLGCGQPGHFRRHCPTNPSSEPVLPRAQDQPAASHPARSQQSTAANNQQKARPQQSVQAPARTYAMHGRTNPSPDVILGTFILFDSVMHALIDPVASSLDRRLFADRPPLPAPVARRRKPAAIISVQLEQPAAGVALLQPRRTSQQRPYRRQKLVAAQRRRCFLRHLSPPHRRRIAAPPRPAPDVASSRRRRASNCCFTFAGRPPPVAAQRRRRRFTSSFCRTSPPLPASFPAVDCSAASRCSSPTTVHLVVLPDVASTAGVLPRRRLQHRQSLFIAVELPLRHCRRPASTMAGGKSKSKASKKKVTVEASSSAPKPFPYLDGSFLEFGSEEELNQFHTHFAKHPISPPRVLPELYPQQKGYHDLDNQVQASGLWLFVSRSRQSYNPAFVRAFYSNLHRDGDTICSSINLYDIEIDLPTFARIAGLPIRGDDIATYGGDDWILNNEAVVIRELGITNLIRHSGAPTIHSAPPDKDPSGVRPNQKPSHPAFGFQKPAFGIWFSALVFGIRTNQVVFNIL